MLKLEDIIASIKLEESVHRSLYWNQCPACGEAYVAAHKYPAQCWECVAKWAMDCLEWELAWTSQDTTT